MTIHGVTRGQRSFASTIATFALTMGLAIVCGGAVSAGADAAGCPNEAFRDGPSALLPNCRAFEQVSPADKNGQAAVKTGYPSRATADGDAIEFPSLGRYANSPGGAFPNAYVARREDGKWSVANVSPPGTSTPTPPGGAVTSYDFSADLGKHVLKIPLQPLTPGASPEIGNLFLRGTSGDYSLINNVTPPVTLPAECPIPSLEIACWQFVDQYTFAGASADFTRVLYEARASLLEGFDELFQSNLEAGSWHVSPVGVLPDGLPAPEGSTAGSGVSTFASTASPNSNNRVADAMSTDGSRVIFQANSDEGEPDEVGQLGLTQVYDRLGGTQTIELSAPAPGAAPAHPGAAPATFWAASANGDRVFFTSAAELTTDSNTGPAHEGVDLYEYDFARPGGELRDVTPDSVDPAGAQVLGVLEASEDGSVVYFVARAQLDGGAGTAGEPNLYVSREGGPPTFIATLSEADGENWTQSAALRESYVTPDGGHVAFTSVNSIPTLNFPSGYNNVNEETGGAEREVYEYSAGSGDLYCASCDPSGAPPIGPGLLGGVHRPNSADISQSSSFHAVRAVSDNGSQVFFSSQDPLTDESNPANADAKVYQWEAPGQPGCSSASGCVGLISGPDPTREAVFLDASATGDDVFFATTEGLVPSDKDGLLDVYDARVGGGIAEQPERPPCAGEAECRGSSSPSPVGSGAATPSFQGPGNAKRSPVHRCPKGKVRHHKKCVRAPQKHAKHRKHRAPHKHKPNMKHRGNAGGKKSGGRG